MKVARYIGGGEIAIVEEPEPLLPEGGLIVQTEASGLCSGELMQWYMDRKVPHVLGHEVSGLVVASDSERFPVGTRVFPHHHAPCLHCEMCQSGREVHCPQWKATKLLPGGMAERFAVPAGNLNDTIDASGLRAIDAALIEPLACVVKAIRGTGPSSTGFQPVGTRAFQALSSKATEEEASSTGFQPVGSGAFRALSEPEPAVKEINPGSSGEPELMIKHGAYLPHWIKEGGTYSVTFRLADAVPRSVAEEWRDERERLERLLQSGSLSDKQHFEYRRLLADRIDAYLDAGSGSRALEKPGAASIVSEAIKHFDGKRYDLASWCVMPNHVHAVVKPRGSHSLSEIVHSWKSFTSNKVNEEVGREGQLWQPEYYDHLIRSEEDAIRCCNYVLGNPSKAGLVGWQWVGTGSGFSGAQDGEGPKGPGSDSGVQGLEAPGTHGLEGCSTGTRTLESGADAGVQGLEAPGTHGLEGRATGSTAVIGLGVMGLMHCLVLKGSKGYDLNSDRIQWAADQGIDASHPDEAAAADYVFVCPGSQAAFELAMKIINPGGTIVMFAPLGPGEDLRVPQEAYFKDVTIRHSYSCGPTDTKLAFNVIVEGRVRAEQVVSDFISLDELPGAYQRMKRGEILKPMVVF